MLVVGSVGKQKWIKTSDNESGRLEIGSESNMQVLQRNINMEKMYRNFPPK